MPDVRLVASNDLDEYLIENLIMVQKTPYDTFAAGTKLVTAYDTPALGGVFKTKSYMGQPKIKIAEGKTTIPGMTDTLRITATANLRATLSAGRKTRNLSATAS